MGDDLAPKKHPNNNIRWLIVFLFDLISFVNAIIWISFTPINTYAQTYYNVGLASIDLLSTIFMILFAPGLIICTLATKRFGLCWTCIGAAGLNALAALLRYASTWSAGRDTGGIYSLALIGQTIGALAQPISVSLPTRIASTWFNDNQRVMAIALLSLSNPFGVAIGQVLPGILVGDDGDGFALLQLLITALTVVIFISCLMGFKERPDTIVDLDDAAPLPQPESSSEMALMATTVIQMFSSRSFVALSLGFGLGLAVFNVLLTKIEVVAVAAHFTSDDAGIFGATCMLCGFVGAGVFGTALDATRAYRRVLRACTIASLASLLGVFIALPLGVSFGVMCVIFGVLGFFLIPLMPIAFECAAIATYPIAEEMSTGMLMLMGNTLGFIGTLATSNYTRATFLPNVSLGDMILSSAFIVAAIANLFYDVPPSTISEPVSRTKLGQIGIAVE